MEQKHIGVIHSARSVPSYVTALSEAGRTAPREVTGCAIDDDWSGLLFTRRRAAGKGRKKR